MKRTVNQNKEFYRNCIRAFGKTDWQVIISMGTNTERFTNIPDNIQIYESVDQMAVLSISEDDILVALRKVLYEPQFQVSLARLGAGLKVSVS